jgi:hypothetical protein
MVRKYLLGLFFAFIGFSVFANPLNTRTAADCLRQIDHFIEDYDSYFMLTMEIAGVSGRVYDNNQIILQPSDNRIHLTILYENEVMLRISLTKSSTEYTTGGHRHSIEFDYSQQTGFRTIYAETYPRGMQYDIRYVLLSLFEAFGLA